VLALTDRKYLHALQHYRANLIRRNAALRNAFKRSAGDAQVSVWEPALAEHGTVIIEARARWVEESSADFTGLCEKIGERGEARMKYLSPFAESEARYDVLLAAFEEKRALDLKRGLTHVGPHRDDLELTLDGREFRTFGSAGQQRTAAIALRMLEAATLRKHAGAEPILLLDDPFAELDIHRAAKILLMLEQRGLAQTILAVPRQSDIPPGLMRLDQLRIHDGVLS
jgi:DNA replication and repair protein RecF